MTSKRGRSEAEDLTRPDFLWNAFLEGMATMGNANGYAGLIENLENYAQVTFDKLVPLSPEERATTIEEVLRRAKVRWARSKAAYLSANVDRILELGGLEAARDILLNSPGREGKIKFLATFSGIGPKYAPASSWIPITKSSATALLWTQEFRKCPTPWL